MADMLDLLVIVFDGRVARFFKGDGSAGLKPVSEMHSGLHRFARDAGSDKGGRRFSPTSRHAMEPKHDLHKEEKHDFVVKLAKTLDTAYDQGAFKRLIVVAPERSLGEFRKVASERLMKLMVGQVPNELTRCTDHEIMERLRTTLSEAAG